MIVGTAGHIDHGKTSLVRALTGVDTDRLKEEKARGISIDLGFAYWPRPSGEIIGFVDVPGHEGLVHNMLAGATGIDFVILVVAADDGVMPQTVEHLHILNLLGVREGSAVITKIDRMVPVTDFVDQPLLRRAIKSHGHLSAALGGFLRGRLRMASAVLSLRGSGDTSDLVKGGLAGPRGKQLKDGLKTAPDISEALLGVSSEQLPDGRGVGFLENGRLGLFDAPADTGQRETIGEHEMLDPQDALDVRPAVDALATAGFRDAEIRELGLP
jgi:hypothetical protein